MSTLYKVDFQNKKLESKEEITEKREFTKREEELIAELSENILLKFLEQDKEIRDILLKRK